MCVSRTVANRKQSGAALIAFLFIFVTAASFALLKRLNEVATQQHRDAQTIRVLAEAKAALIGHAASANIVPTGVGSCGENCPRPGDLPCPDQDNDGIAESNCGDPSSPSTDCAKTTGPTGSACRRFGRLPWKTLGLPDFRDGSGERLWYAVSTSFKNNTRTNCGSSGLPGCLNSDSRGTVTVKNSSGSILHAGDNPDPYVPSGAVAVIIAPGPALQREDGTDQDRSCIVGANCDTNDVCTQATLTGTPKCRAINFLDRTTDEDNQQFSDGSSSDGFIQGSVFDSAGNVIVNDRVFPITYSDIMPLLEKRVVAEVLSCLKEYAAPTAPNNGRYPWAAKLDPGASPEFDDDSGERFGRLPDGQSLGLPGIRLNETKTAIGLGAWDYWPNKDILSSSNCKLTSNVSPNTWWLNWKELVFYSVAGGFEPAPTTPSCGPLPKNCLTVDPPSSAPDKKVVVIAAGKRLLGAVASGQPRTLITEKADISNYLEGNNATPLPPDDSFTVQALSSTFNDVVCKQGIC